MTAQTQAFQEAAQRLLGDAHPDAVTWLATDLRRRGAVPSNIPSGGRQLVSAARAVVRVEVSGQLFKYALQWSRYEGVWGLPEEFRPLILPPVKLGKCN